MWLSSHARGLCTHSKTAVREELADTMRSESIHMAQHVNAISKIPFFKGHKSGKCAANSMRLEITAQLPVRHALRHYCIS